MDRGFPQFIPTNVMDVPQLGSRDASSFALTASLRSKMEKQKLLAQPSADLIPLRFTVPPVRPYALRKL